AFPSVDGLDRIERHKGEERTLGLRELDSTFDHFKSESTFVPSMWRTVRETSAEPRVADSKTRTCESNAPGGRWGLTSSRRNSALPFRGGTWATPRPWATKLEMIAVRSQST